MSILNFKEIQECLPSLAGSWTVTLPDGSVFDAALPGTLDENQIGEPDLFAVKWHPDDELALENEANTGLAIDGVITTRLTRKYTFTGPAVYSRTLKMPPAFQAHTPEQPSLRLFLDVERSRKLSLSVNGESVLPFIDGTVSTPYSFELTGLLKEENQVALTCDNSYPGWPASSITYSSAATDETQTNWNGLIGNLSLRLEKNVIVKQLLVRPERNRPDSAQLRHENFPGRPDSVQCRPVSDASAVQAENNGRPENKHGRPDSAQLRPDNLPDRPDSIEILLVLNAAADVSDTIRISCSALAEDHTEQVALHPGDNELRFTGLKLRPDVKCWDEYEGNLYSLSVSGESFLTRTITTGFRSFCDPRSPYLTLNGRRIFLRCETSCAVYPETGHPPMDEAAWDRIMETYRSYGVNCVRFHSFCPPEAAFAAADRAGILCEPELSNWDPYTAFATDEAKKYYRLELLSILRTFGSHPSFVMLSLGNELHYSDDDAPYVRALLDEARAFDPTRLYMNASNAFYGQKGTDEGSDCYTSCFYFSEDLRGTSSGMKGPINNEAPSSERNFDETLARIRQVYHRPVFAFETGQYQTLPFFEELPLFTGVTRPDNLRTVRDRAEQFGLLDNWEKRAAASGELALLCYRAEYESVLATREYSGISILGLQDFPGQGTALIGMMNSHLLPKAADFARPERFESFFRPVLPLLRLKKYTYTSEEAIDLTCLLANYGKEGFLAEATLQLCLADRSGKTCGKTIHEIKINKKEYPQGTLTKVCTTVIPPLSALTEVCGAAIPSLLALKEGEIGPAGFHAPCVLLLKAKVGEHESSTRIWIYPPLPAAGSESCGPDTRNVILTDNCEEALAHLSQGRRVLLSPPADELHMPGSVPTHFSTDLWSVGTYTYQDGYMGILTDPDHPALQGFPTAYHADWQWWQITKDARAFQLQNRVHSVIEVLDCYARLRNLSLLAEFKFGTGKLMLSGMGLLQKTHYPEAVSLLEGILKYMNSEEFAPTREITEEELKKILR